MLRLWLVSSAAPLFSHATVHSSSAPWCVRRPESDEQNYGYKFGQRKDYNIVRRPHGLLRYVLIFQYASFQNSRSLHFCSHLAGCRRIWFTALA